MSHLNQIPKRILVVGAGPVGLSAAYFLNKMKGIQVQIVQKKHVPDEKILSKALLVNSRTMTIFDNTPIGKELQQKSLKLSTVRIFQGLNLKLQNNLTQLIKQKTKYPYFYIHPQGLTEKVIQKYLLNQGIKVQRGMRVENVKDHGDHVQVWFQGQHQSKKIDIVLATDGAHSTVRKCLGLKLEGQTLDHKLYLCDADIQGYDKLAPQIHIFPQTFLLIVPMQNKIRIVGTAPNYKDYLPKQWKLSGIEWESQFTINNRTISKMNSGNIYFAGDSAHVHAPIGGRGCNLGIEDAYVFSKLLEKGKLSQYHAQRKPKVEGFVNQVKSASAFLIANKHPYLKKFVPKFVPYINFLVQKRMALFPAGLDYDIPQLNSVKPKL